MNTEELKSVAAAIVGKQKGVLAADESSPTIKKRFASIDLESTEEHRRRYRELLFTAPGIEQYIGGVILFDETLRQATMEGVPFADLLSSRGIVPGIKVDKGAKALAGYTGERVTEGLDGLRDRLAEYRKMGARFANGARSSILTTTISLPHSGFMRTHIRSRAMPRCVRKPTSFPLSSRRC